MTEGSVHKEGSKLVSSWGCLVAQSRLALWDPMDWSLSGSSVPGILQARILEWVAISSSRSLPDPGIEPMSPALQVDSLTLSHLRNLIYSPKYMQQSLTELKGNNNSIRLVGCFRTWFSTMDRTTRQRISEETDVNNAQSQQVSQKRVEQSTQQEQGRCPSQVHTEHFLE